jgi:hypothetical protein
MIAVEVAEFALKEEQHPGEPQMIQELGLKVQSNERFPSFPKRIALAKLSLQ